MNRLVLPFPAGEGRGAGHTRVALSVAGFRLFVLSAAFFSTHAVYAADWSGNVSAELRAFAHAGLSAEQHDMALSIAAQPEYHQRWDGDNQSFTFTPFARFDQYDAERTHADIRELTWLSASVTHEWRIGVRKVFWGVTESQHLVDIINQTDGVENPDGEDKLGQPMINLATIRAWGTVDVFALLGFRERTFPGAEGRLRPALPVATSQSQYESEREWRHVDAALRYRQTLGDWDIGLSYFSGTSRDPRLLPGQDVAGAPVLIPYYDLIEQVGIDAQATLGSWLWKLEGIHRSGQGASYYATTGGFEYTVSGAFATGMDLGFIAEYLYDERGSDAPTPFQRDVMIGCRLAVNDEQSAEILFGTIIDTTDSTRLYNLEASRRLGSEWKLSAEARVYANVAPRDPVYSLRDDDYVQVELARYF